MLTPGGKRFLRTHREPLPGQWASLEYVPTIPLSEFDDTPPPAEPLAPKTFIVGLDLGQAADYSALCVVERTTVPDPIDATRNLGSYGVRHLHRWKLGTPYTVIVRDVSEWGARTPLPGCPLVVDGTGVGRAVVDMFRQAKLPLKLVPVTITAGHTATAEPGGGWNVPKKDLVAAMQTLVQSRRFHIAPALPDAAILGRELQMFRVKVTAVGNETFEALREREHDDLVLSVAMACWFGERPAKRFWVM